MEGPLAQFQATRFDKADFHRLVTTINSNAGESKLADSIVETVFQKWWPDLASKLDEIIKSHATRSAPPVREVRELVEEILLLTRTIAAEQSDQNKSRPAQPQGKYHGSLYQRLLEIINYYETNYHLVISDSSDDDENSAVHQMFAALLKDIPRRMSQSEIRDGLVAALAKLANRTKPHVKAADDDEVPF